MDHITFWVPTFVAAIAIDLDELLEDRASAPNALCSKPGGIMEMAIDIPFVFIVRVLRTK